MAPPDFDDDKRQDPRFYARFDVRFTRVSDAARAFNAYSLNFSAGGLCLRSSGTHAVGDYLKLDLTIGPERFALDGIVAWSRGEAVGVRFANVRPELRERLEAVARSLAHTTRTVGQS
jgi:Tfp pilus assembly protein PilZ